MKYSAVNISCSTAVGKVKPAIIFFKTDGLNVLASDSMLLDSTSGSLYCSANCRPKKIMDLCKRQKLELTKLLFAGSHRSH